MNTVWWKQAPPDGKVDKWWTKGKNIRPSSLLARFVDDGNWKSHICLMTHATSEFNMWCGAVRGEILLSCVTSNHDLFYVGIKYVMWCAIKHLSMTSRVTPLPKEVSVGLHATANSQLLRLSFHVGIKYMMWCLHEWRILAPKDVYMCCVIIRKKREIVKILNTPSLPKEWRQSLCGATLAFTRKIFSWQADHLLLKCSINLLLTTAARSIMRIRTTMSYITSSVDTTSRSLLKKLYPQIQHLIVTAFKRRSCVLTTASHLTPSSSY